MIKLKVIRFLEFIEMLDSPKIKLPTRQTLVYHLNEKNRI